MNAAAPRQRAPRFVAGVRFDGVNHPRPSLAAVLLTLAVLHPAASFAAVNLAVRVVTAPADATIGFDVTLVAQLENAGTEALAGYKIGIYLSPDAALSVFDRRLGGIDGPDLAPGETRTIELTTRVPENIAAGSYTLGIIVDDTLVLGELPGAMLDNTKGASPPTRIKVPSPDFVALKVGFGGNVAGGEIVPVQLSLANRGVRPGEARAAFYLSANDNITATDPMVGQKIVAVEPGVELDFTAWVRLPPGLAPGRYYLGVWLDPDNLVPELSEDNNKAVSTAGTVLSASLLIDTSFLPDALVGVPYVRSLVASGGDAPYEWKLATGTALPEGLSLSKDGVLTGAAQQEGTTSPRIVVQSGTRTASSTYILRAYRPTTPLEVATRELPPAVKGTPYEAPLAAAGGTPPYSWKLSSGALPSGLTLTTAGLLRGQTTVVTPTTAPTPMFELEVTDVSGTSALRDFSVRVLGTSTLAINQLTLEDATAGEPYLAKLQPAGGDAPFKWALAAGALPEGLAAASEGNALTIVGKARETGIFRFALRLEDAAGQADRNSYILRVLDTSIGIITTVLPDATRGEPYDEELTSTSSGVTWRVAGGELPPGFELTPEGHLRAIDGAVPERAPTRTFTFIAEIADGHGGLGRAGLALRILAIDDGTDASGGGGCDQAGAPILAVLGALALALRRRRSAFAALLMLLVAPVARAQTPTEFFSRSETQETYPELTAPTLLDLDGQRDTQSVKLDFPAGFVFPYYGSSITTANVGIDGYLAFAGNGREFSNKAVPNASTPNGVVAPWWDDLEIKRATPGVPGVPATPTTPEVPPIPSVPSPSKIQWALEGAAPDRVLVVEWVRLARFGDAEPTDGEYSFQARLFEDGSLEFHYRGRADGQVAPPFTATVGVESPDGSEGQMSLACAANCVERDFPSGKRIRFERHIDLVPATITAPTLAHGGIPAAFSVAIRNQGSLEAASFLARLYLSTDRSFDAEQDTQLFEVTVTALGRGDTRTIAQPAVAMPEVEPGTYYPFLIVDPDGELTDSNPDNNTKIGEPLHVGAPAPDFVVVAVVADRTEAAPGDSVNVTIRLGNKGNREGLAPWVVVGSLNDVLSLADRQFASGAMEIASGGEDETVATFTLPADLLPGPYRIGVLVDANEDPTRQTLEINEFNNSGRAERPLNVASAATISTVTLPNATAGAAYSFRLRSTGGDGLDLWGVLSGTSLPAGLALTSRGDIEGIPTTPGLAHFTLRLMSSGTQTTRDFTLQVDAANLVLSFVTTELPAAIHGREYSARLLAHGGAPPYVFTLAPGSESGLPPGLGLDPHGAVAGVPIAGGEFALSFTVADATGKEVERALTLRVLPPGRPVIDARPLAEALVNVGYAAQLGAVGGKPPYRWILEETRRFDAFAGQATEKLTTLPGLALTDTGSLTGTPRELGLYALNIRVEDATGANDRDTILLEVRAERGIAILTSLMPPGEVGRDYDEPIVATGGDGTLRFSLIDALQLLPDGLALRADGRIQGRPGAAGLRTVIVRVEDDARRVDFRALTLEVMAPRVAASASSCASAGGSGFAVLLALGLLGLRRRRLLGALVLSASALACVPTEIPRDLCVGAPCQPGETCDPEDGSCRCGGLSGRACTLEESCNSQTFACELLDRCTLVQCTRGMACDGADGVCKCGGAACNDGELCDPTQGRCVTADLCAQVSCVGGLACDPADGRCKCGDGSLTCNANERCEAGICKVDVCASVTCTGGTSCDPDDQRCKCGGAGGEPCLYGQTCEPLNKRCVASRECAFVVCSGGTSCDPANGLCRCGGAGGPVCGTGQSCDLERRACIGGNRCATIVCATGTCDPEDGECHCGEGGPVCLEGQKCELTATSRACRTACDPVAQTPCGSGDSCAFNPTSKLTVCGVAGTRSEGATCSGNADCSRGLHCLQSLSTSACRAYCTRPSGACSAAGKTCKVLSGAPATLGVCN